MGEMSLSHICVAVPQVIWVKGLSVPGTRLPVGRSQPPNTTAPLVKIQGPQLANIFASSLRMPTAFPNSLHAATMENKKYNQIGSTSVFGF